MSINNIFYPHMISFSNSPLGEVVRFDSVSSSMNYNMIKRMGGADPYPCFVGAGSAEPQIDFTTPSIKSVLSVCTDQFVVRDLTGNNVELQYRAGKPQSFRETLTDAKHLRVKLVESAMLYWTQFSVRESEDATMSAVLVTKRKDASTDPILLVGNEQMDSSLCESIYSLGPVIFNNRPLASIHSVNWQNNVRPYSRITANVPTDPCWQSLHDFSPVITCLTNDLFEVMNERPAATVLGPGLGDIYGGQEMFKLQIFLRKRKRTGFYEADSAAEHIELRAFGGWKAATGIDGMEPAEGTLEFHVSQAVSSTGVISTDVLMNRLIDIAIPNLDPSVAPSIPAVATQSGPKDNPFFFVPEIGTGGLPYSDPAGPAGWTLDVSPPPGLALDPFTGIISGTPTVSATTSVVLTAVNGAGSSPQGFDIDITP